MRMCKAIAAGMGILVLVGVTWAGDGDLILVPEMERISGIRVERPSRRTELQSGPEAERALAAMRKRVTELWPQIRRVDLLALSRYQVEATKGYVLPDQPVELQARVVGRDARTGSLSVEIRGPRLPAKHAIVYRYLYLYCSFDPQTGTTDPLTVTIRGWVEE